VVGRLEVVGDNYGTRPCESSAERSGHCRVGEALQVYKNCCAVADRRVIRGKGDGAESRDGLFRVAIQSRSIMNYTSFYLYNEIIFGNG